MLKPVLAVLLVLVSLPLAACGERESPGQIRVSDLRLVRVPGGFPTVSGVFVNQTDSDIRSADVGVQLFNERNLPYDEPARFVVRNIASGDSVRFRHRIGVDARGARLEYVQAN